MRWWPRRRWARLLATVTLIFTAVALWQYNFPEPTTVNYCVKYQDVNSVRTCLENKRLYIPGAYGGAPVPDSPRQWHQLDLVYPSMRPSRSVPWLDRTNAQRLTIHLFAINGPARAQQKFARSLKTWPNFVPSAPLYGLVHYVGEGWGKRQLLLSTLPAPSLVIDCARGDDPTDLAGINLYACTTTTHTSWNLELRYYHRRELLPEWQTVHSKVLAFVDSLAVTP